MTIIQTLAVFVGIPVLIYVLIGVFTLLPGRGKSRRPKYRPGAEWEFPAQWWAGDQPVVVAGDGDQSGLNGGGARGTW